MNFNGELIETSIIPGEIEAKSGGYRWGWVWSGGQKQLILLFFLKIIKAKRQWKSLYDKEYERESKLSSIFIDILASVSIKI